MPVNNSGHSVAQEGDKWFFATDGRVDPFVYPLGRRAIANPEGLFLIRPIAPQGWISVKDVPLEARAGQDTICLKKDGQLCWQGGPSRTWSSLITHYLPTPPKPNREIKVGEHKVDFRKDGSIRVGCTEVSSELFEQISERRKEEMR